jgi:hypothetical protein
MKICLLVKYDDISASTRQRFLLYKPFLEEVGIEIVFRPLLSKNYLQNFYRTGNRMPVQLIISFFKRLYWLLTKNDVDLIWLSYELFPYMPGFIEKILSWQKKPIVYDYDDAIFHNYDLSSNVFVRKFLGNKLHSTISNAEIAFCGNSYLADYAQPHCNSVAIVPTILNTEIFCPNKNYKSNSSSPLRVGWIGTPSTWNKYFQDKLPLFREITKKDNIQFSVMGGGKNAKQDPLIEYVEWNEKSELKYLQSLDVGIMPLVNTPWALGKCGYKLIQYMACGLPVLASPVGTNLDIVEHGVNGFLVESDDEWRGALQKLINDSDLRHRMGMAGRKKIEEKYSLKIWGPRVAQLLYSLIKNKTKKK